MKSFAQNFEDVMLWRALHHVECGFFIDIGAQHPIKDSVSKVFSEHGWTGIHVEPVPLYADMLRSDRPQDQIIEAIVSDTKGLCTFYEIEGTGLSTSNKYIADRHKSKNFEYQSIVVSSITLDDILLINPDREIHWLKIDVEGSEKSVLNGWNNLDRKPWIIVVESTEPGTQISNFLEWEKLITDKAYNAVYSDGLNRFYLSSDHKELSHHFSYPPNIFDGFQISQHSDHVIEIVRDHQSTISQLEARMVVDAELIRSQADALVSQIRSETNDQLDQAQKREKAIITSATTQKRFWLDRCRQLRQRLQIKHDEFLVREHEARYQSDQLIAHARTQADEELRAVEAQLNSAVSREAALTNLLTSVEKRHAESMIAVLARERESQSRSEQAMEEARIRVRELQDGLRRQLEVAQAQLDAVIQREEILTRTLLLQEEMHASALASIKSLNDEKSTNFIREIEEYENKIVNMNSEIQNLNILLSKKDNIINYLIKYISYVQIAIIDLMSSRVLKILSYANCLSKISDFPEKIKNILRIVRASDVVVSMEIGNIAPSSSGNPDDEVNPHSAVYSDPAMHQDNSKLKNVDMPFLHGKNIIDLMSLGLDQFIIMSYNLLLGRNPDQSELRIHGSSLRAGLGRSKMLFEIISSPEYKKSYENTVEIKSDEDFISWLYDRYMHRTPDAAGLAHYAGMLARGVKREQVKRDIAGSKEARSTGSLWFELDRLMDAERQKQKHRRHWLRRSQPSDRQQHQQQEALLQLFHDTGAKLRAAPHSTESAPGDLPPHAADVTMAGMAFNQVVRPVAPLEAVDMNDMPPEARRIIVRLQHAMGVSMNKGHA